MLKPFLTECSDCANLQELMCGIDGALLRYGKNAWDNTRFDLLKPFPREHIKTLTRYRYILSRKVINQDYASCIPLANLISHVKILIVK